MSQTQIILSKPILGKLSINSLLALAGIVGPLILVVTDFTAAFSDPNYNFIHDSISSLAWTRLGWIQTIGFLTIGLLVELFVAGLLFSIRGRKGFGFGITLLVFFGFGLLLIGAFHTDQAGGPHTMEGAIHGVAAKIIFWLFPLANLLITPSLRKSIYWKSLFVYSIAAAGLAIVLMISSVWLSDESGFFGLFERILVADEVIWVAIMAIWLLRLSLRPSLKVPD
jgi:hypothetical protein